MADTRAVCAREEDGMSGKTSAEVIIGGKVYTLSGYEGEEYLQRVATYINNKINLNSAIWKNAAFSE